MGKSSATNTQHTAEYIADVCTKLNAFFAF